jgi:beta-aspartyl-peptidase (threonine type)
MAISTQTTLLIHGGAGTILKEAMTPERERAHTQGLLEALQAGRVLLERGASSMDAVLAAVCSMEDNPLFNAGRGAVFTADGRHEMDASVMDGRQRQAGAVASVRGVRHPILLAHAVLAHSPHVFLGGSGAEAFARKRGLEFMPEAWFDDPLRRRQWEKLRGSEEAALDHSVLIEDNVDPEPPDDHALGTVGAVALDRYGHLAAATSTGGMTNKRWGRIGDSPVIGSGTFSCGPVPRTMWRPGCTTEE